MSAPAAANSPLSSSMAFSTVMVAEADTGGGRGGVSSSSSKRERREIGVRSFGDFIPPIDFDLAVEVGVRGTAREVVRGGEICVEERNFPLI